MAKTLQFRRGTTAELSSVTGAEGELFVDTTKDTVVVMDGSTAGGKPLATEAYVGTAISNLVDSAPGALDTLNELAAALGDDANFATSISNTVATAGGYANSAYGQANTATTDAATADQRAVTSGSYANSAYSKANTALIHAQAAFNAANTGGGGGGGASTGDFTFSANTITLPDYTDATINVHGNVTTTITTSTPVTYTKGEGNWDGMIDVTWDMTTLYYGAGSGSAFGQQLRDNIPSGTSITLQTEMGSTQTLTTTTDFSYDSMMMRWKATVGTSTMMMRNYTSLTFDVESSEEVTSNQDFTYTFSSSGEFISDSALLGTILISDNILSALPLISDDSYQTETPQPVIINGDFEVLGNVTGDFTVTGLFKSNQSAEGYVNITSTASGTYGIPLNFNSGAIFYSNQRDASFDSINFTNIPRVAGQVVTVTLILNQNTAYMPTNFYIDNNSVTPYWLGGSAPSGTDDTIDVLSFTIMWISGTSYTVLASATNYAAA